MYLLLIAAAAFLFCGATLAADTDIQEDTDGILVLNRTNFDTAIMDNSLIAVIFYMPNDEGVDERAPVYAAAAAKLKAESPTIKLAKVNLRTQRVLASNYGVNIISKILFFKNGQNHKAMNVGQSTADDIVQWVQTVPSPPFPMKRKWCSCFGC